MAKQSKPKAEPDYRIDSKGNPVPLKTPEGQETLQEMCKRVKELLARTQNVQGRMGVSGPVSDRLTGVEHALSWVLGDHNYVDTWLRTAEGAASKFHNIDCQCNICKRARAASDTATS